MSKTTQRKRAQYQKYYNLGYEARTHGYKIAMWPAWYSSAEGKAYIDGYKAAAEKLRVPPQVLKKRSRWRRFIHWLFLI